VLRLNRQTLRNLRDDRSGASAITTGVVMVAVMGFVGLGTDLGTWYGARREAQHAADSAAYSAAAAAMSGAGDITAQANAIAARYGLKNGVDGVKVTVTTLTGPDRYEVVIERPAKRFFSGLILKRATGAIRARAVASVGRQGDGCVLALNPKAEKSVHINGSPDVNLMGCSLYVNAKNASGLYMNGSATLSADSVELGGASYFKNGSGSISAKDGIHYNQPPASDPYANVQIPPFEGCTKQEPVLSATFENVGGRPKVFCNGLTINGSGTVIFKPGVYVFDRGEFLINGSTTVIAEGVTFVFTSTTGSNYATMKMNGSAKLQMSAPTTGPTAGLLFFQDQRAPDAHEVHINGSANGWLRGAIYFPRQHVRFNGSAAIGEDRCLQLIADTIEFNGSAKFKIDCAGTGVKPIGGLATVLVE
jgi:Flp pilus assembly protein TadG